MLNNEELLNKINQVLEKNEELEKKIEQLTKTVDQHEFKIQELLLLLRKGNSSNTITNSTLSSSPTNTIINNNNNNNSPPISPRNSCEITPPPSLSKSNSTDSFSISSSNNSNSNNNNNNNNSNINNVSPTNTLSNSISSNSPNISPITSPQLSGSNASKPRIQYMGMNRQSSANNLFKKEDSSESLLKFSVSKDGETFYVPPITPRAPKSPSMDFISSSSLVNSLSNSKSNESISSILSTSATISEKDETNINDQQPQQQDNMNNNSNNINNINNNSIISPYFTDKFNLTKLPSNLQYAIVWEYSASDDEWTRGLIVVEMESKPFAKGALRNAYKMYIRSNPMQLYDHFKSNQHDKYHEGKRMNMNGTMPQLLGPVDTLYVAKDSKTNVSFERYFEDVKMQMICREYGSRYNSNNPPKKIEFLSAWVIEVQQQSKNQLYGIEFYMKGDFKKQNSNYGSVLTDRNTPQAFSHFTYECSNHDMLVIDIQGVDDIYTDPQVHTKDGKGYGDGNLGMRGIDRFLQSHKCNPICLQFGLPAIGVMLNDTRNAHRVIRGTMLLPDLIPDLHEPEYPSLEQIPKNPQNSELVLFSELTGHNERISSLLIHKNKLYSGSADGTVKIWQLGDDDSSGSNNCFKLLDSFRAHRRSIEKILISEKYLFTASSDGTIKVWQLSDVNITDCKFKLDEHSAEVNDMCLDEFNNVLISCSFDKSIKVWDLETMKCVKSLNAHSKSVKSIYLSGKYLFSSSNDQSIKVWDLEMMMCVYGMSDAHDSWITLLRMFNNRLISASKDGQLKEWNLSTFLSTTTIEESHQPITDLLVTSNGYSFIASEDSTIKILDLTKVNQIKVINSTKAHRSGVQSLQTDGKRIFSGGLDNIIKVWLWKDKNN